jgi:hypothetical protein
VSLPDQSELRASVFTDVENFRSNFLAVPPSTPPRNIGRMTLNQEVPVNAVGAHRSVLAGVRPALHLRRHRLAVGRRRQQRRRARPGDRDSRDAPQGFRRNTSGSWVHTCKTCFKPMSRLTLTLSDRGRQLEQLRRSQSRDRGRPWSPDQQHSVAALAQRHGEQSTSGRALPGQRRHQRMVRRWLGLPGPDPERALRQFRVGTTLTLPNNELGPERLFGVRRRRDGDAGKASDGSCHAVRQSAEGIRYRT